MRYISRHNHDGIKVVGRTDDVVLVGKGKKRKKSSKHLLKKNKSGYTLQERRDIYEQNRTLEFEAILQRRAELKQLLKEAQ
jgi:hypothetical protein